MKDSGMTGEVVSESSGVQSRSVPQHKIIIRKVNSLLNFVGVTLFRLRKIVLATPVVYAALRLASYNRENLPDLVGFNLQSSGEFTHMISRDAAVLGPLGLTCACLLLMFCSRKAMYPWAISVFTLALPLLLLFSNLYPA